MVCVCVCMVCMYVQVEVTWGQAVGRWLGDGASHACLKCSIRMGFKAQGDDGHLPAVVTEHLPRQARAVSCERCTNAWQGNPCCAALRSHLACSEREGSPAGVMMDYQDRS